MARAAVGLCSDGTSYIGTVLAVDGCYLARGLSGVVSRLRTGAAQTAVGLNGAAPAAELAAAPLGVATRQHSGVML